MKKSLGKRKVATVAMTLGFALLASVAFAAPILSIDPPTTIVGLGTPVDVALTISGLGELAPPSLGLFNVDVSFESTILAFSSATFGDPMLGDQLDLFGFGSLTAVTPGGGTINLSQLSLDIPDALDSFQRGSFTLATLTFGTIGVGTSLLGLNVNSLGDAFGLPLQASVQGGKVSVVPEPATLLLIGSGLVGITGLRRRTRKTERA